ncbi:hypothetical protein F7725_013686 [Dissostichus mawsoni]|uniref:Uncharacterized protein n=1 Tax=Dissostichus mawsoni TaxID=36200 RepID=A0A7J5YXZ2_DISMA|nr:hypothetical protein F7725_013686 [Dissostichus mawsoni]
MSSADIDHISEVRRGVAAVAHLDVDVRGDFWVNALHRQHDAEPLPCPHRARESCFQLIVSPSLTGMLILTSCFQSIVSPSLTGIDSQPLANRHVNINFLFSVDSQPLAHRHVDITSCFQSIVSPSNRHVNINFLFSVDSQPLANRHVINFLFSVIVSPSLTGMLILTSCFQLIVSSSQALIVSPSLRHLIVSPSLTGMLILTSCFQSIVSPSLTGMLILTSCFQLIVSPSLTGMLILTSCFQMIVSPSLTVDSQPLAHRHVDVRAEQGRAAALLQHEHFDDVRDALVAAALHEGFHRVNDAGHQQRDPQVRRPHAVQTLVVQEADGQVADGSTRRRVLDVQREFEGRSEALHHGRLVHVQLGLLGHVEPDALSQRRPGRGRTLDLTVSQTHQNRLQTPGRELHGGHGVAESNTAASGLADGPVPYGGASQYSNTGCSVTNEGQTGRNTASTVDLLKDLFLMAVLLSGNLGSIPSGVAPEVISYGYGGDPLGHIDSANKEGTVPNDCSTTALAGGPDDGPVPYGPATRYTPTDDEGLGSSTKTSQLSVPITKQLTPSSSAVLFFSVPMQVMTV